MNITLTQTITPYKLLILLGLNHLLYNWPIGHLRWLNTVFTCAFADAIQHVHKDCKNKHAVNSAIILFTQHPHYLCYFFYIWMQCIDGFILSLQRYIRKGNDAKNPAILSFFFVTERTQLSAVHVQLLEKLRPIAFVETCQVLTIQSLEFQEIWQENSSETMWMIYHKKICIFTKGIFNTEHAVKTIYSELWKLSTSKFY